MHVHSCGDDDVLWVVKSPARCWMPQHRTYSDTFPAEHIINSFILLLAAFFFHQILFTFNGSLAYSINRDLERFYITWDTLNPSGWPGPTLTRPSKIRLARKAAGCCAVVCVALWPACPLPCALSGRRERRQQRRPPNKPTTHHHLSPTTTSTPAKRVEFPIFTIGNFCPLPVWSAAS